MKHIPIQAVSLILVLLLFVAGCKKKEQDVIVLYCSSSHLPAATELAKTFQSACNVEVVCIPIDPNAVLQSDPKPPVPQEGGSSKEEASQWYQMSKPEIAYAAEHKAESGHAAKPAEGHGGGEHGKPAEGGHGEKKEEKAAGHEEEAVDITARRQEVLEAVEKVEKWVHESEFKDFPQYLADHRFGDLLLCDSLDDSKRLTEDSLSLRERPIGYLSPVLVVPRENPLGFLSIQDVLDKKKKLGVVSLQSGGLGLETERVLSAIQKDLESTGQRFSQEGIIKFDSQLLLLQAFEKGEVDAAVCWDASVVRIADHALIIRRPPSETAAIPFTIVTLMGTERYRTADLFSTFVASEKGKEILRKHNYRVE